MRSNIARTWPSGSVPVRAADDGMGDGSAAAVCTLLRVRAGARLGLAAQRREELDESGLLLGGQPGEGRHRRRRVLERAQDRPRQELVADVRQVRPRPLVAVLADLVAGEAAGLRDHELAGL